MKKPDPGCRVCNGTGENPISINGLPFTTFCHCTWMTQKHEPRPYETAPCSTCKGTGFAVVRNSDGTYEQVHCYTCNGARMLIVPSNGKP